MSASTHHPSPPDSPPPKARGADVHNIVQDVLLWRKKKQSVALLTAATATWVALEIYQFNFITIASWVAMAVVALMFLWGNLLRLVGKEKQSMSGLEISEELAMEMGTTVRGYVEEGVRGMFRVGAEREWFVFAKAVFALWLLSLVGGCFDFITLLYTGLVMGMSVPVMYEKYEDLVKRIGERMRVQLRRWYHLVDDKLFSKLKHRFGFLIEMQEETKQKEKKVE